MTQHRNRIPVVIRYFVFVTGLFVSTWAATATGLSTHQEIVQVGGNADGFTPARITHRGLEQIIAGPEVDSTVSTVTPEGYGVTGFNRIALSGDNRKVWFVLFDSFPNVPGDPQAQLWSVNLDGPGGLRSALPNDSFSNGLTVETTQDGAVSYIDNSRAAMMYVASVGGPASPAFAYGTLSDGSRHGDIRGHFRVNNAGTRLIYRSFVDTRFMTVDLTASPFVPQEIATSRSMAFMGANARSLNNNIDLAGDATAWISASEHFSRTFEPNLQQILRVGTSLDPASNAPAYAAIPNLTSPGDLNITDDGQTLPIA